MARRRRVAAPCGVTAWRDCSPPQSPSPWPSPSVSSSTTRRVVASTCIASTPTTSWCASWQLTGFDVDYVHAAGSWLSDRDGRRYLDFLAGFGVFALGRCHPAIDRALARRRRLLDLPNLVQMECSPLAGLLAEALVARMPHDGYRCFFTNSGAESVETVAQVRRAARPDGHACSSPTTRSTA